MSKPAFSLWAFSLYMFALGATLVAAPNIPLSLFGVPETHEVWIRVAGMLVLFIGYLDFMASRHELHPFFAWTIPPRLSVPVFFAAFIALGWAPPILILFGVIDAAGALWTAACLRSETRPSPAA
jgi:hypothetical protein